MTSASRITEANPSLRRITLWVRSCEMSDGRERPIGYAFRTLNPSERNYSQLEKEGFRASSEWRNFLREILWPSHQPQAATWVSWRNAVQYTLKRLHESRGGRRVSWRNDIQYPLKRLHKLRGGRYFCQATSTLCHSERQVLMPMQMHSVACDYQKNQLKWLLNWYF